MPITFPTNTRDIINEIRDAIGRDIICYTESKQLCPVCSIDPVTDASTDVYCSNCSGVGYLISYSGDVIKAHVTWAPSETLAWVTGGQYFDGDCRVQIESTDANMTIVEGAKYLTVDGKNCIIKKKMYRGVANINRILIDLALEE